MGSWNGWGMGLKPSLIQNTDLMSVTMQQNLNLLPIITGQFMFDWRMALGCRTSDILL